MAVVTESTPLSAGQTMQGALYGALALILGALAAYFAGRGGAVDPTVTRTAGAPVGQHRL